MDNIQLATTLAAPTGTGNLYVPFSSDANTAAFVVTANPLLKLSFKRTLPKPNGTSLGVERGEVKLVYGYTDANGVTFNSIFTLTSSIPVPVPLATRAAAVVELALLARDVAWANVVDYNRIPL